MKKPKAGTPEYCRWYHEQHRDEINQKCKKHQKAYQERKGEVFKQAVQMHSKASYDRHKEEYKDKYSSEEFAEPRRQRIRKRLQTDVSFKLSLSCRNRILRAIKEQNQTKQKQTFELLGCSVDELKAHLEKQFQPGMSWENHGRGEQCWHIDHIRPCASFDLSDQKQQQLCFNYTNLQPLWESENLSKGAKYSNEHI